MQGWSHKSLGQVRDEKVNPLLEKKETKKTGKLVKELKYRMFLFPSQFLSQFVMVFFSLLFNIIPNKEK